MPIYQVFSRDENDKPVIKEIESKTFHEAEELFLKKNKKSKIVSIGLLN